MRSPKGTFLTLSLWLLPSLVGQEALPFVQAPGAPVVAGPLAGAPVVVDFDRDGHLDVVLACGTFCGTEPVADSGHVIILRGDGKGGLSAAPGMPVQVGESVRKVAVGDIDGDGALDVVAAQHDSYEVVVLHGDGRGGLARKAALRARDGARPHTHDVEVADVDGDGKAEIVTTNANDGDVSILRGGTFGVAAPVLVPVGRHPYDRVLVRDVNGDGRPDLVVPDLHGGTIAVQVQDAQGAFAPARGAPLRAGPRPGYVALADLDGDGDGDLIATHDDDPFVALWRNDEGAFTVWSGSPLRLPEWVWGIAAADFDRDGKVDLAVASYRSGVYVLRNTGGGFALATGSPFAIGKGTSYVAAADLDGDGRPDLVGTGYESGDVTVLRATGAPLGGGAALPPFTTAAAVAALRASDAGEQRNAWIAATLAGKCQDVLRALDPGEGAGADALARFAQQQAARFAIAKGSEMPACAGAIEAACDRALALDANHLEARYQKGLVLGEWPARFGKRPAAIRELELLLQVHGDRDDPRIHAARARLAEWKR